MAIPVYHGLHRCLKANEHKFAELYPSTGAVFLRQGKAPQVGDVFRNLDWADAMDIVCRAERAAQHRGRLAAIEAGRDAFYKGEIAERIAAFIRDNPVQDASGKAHAGLLTFEDMAEWHATVEEPVTVNYRGLDVFKCPSWTQGPVFLQQLTLLEGYDLAAMGHNSAGYLHILIEAAKLAFADREAYYGDPRLDDVPFDVLLSKDVCGRDGVRSLGQRRATTCAPATSAEASPIMPWIACSTTIVALWQRYGEWATHSNGPRTSERHDPSGRHRP